MSYSPPQEASEFRGQTLTPVSPKPVHFPSPSNIPILEQSMDPNFTAQVTEVTPQPSHGDHGNHAHIQVNAPAQSMSDLSLSLAARESNGGAEASQTYGNGHFAASLAYPSNGANRNQNAYNFAQPTNAPYQSGEASHAQPLQEAQVSPSIYSHFASGFTTAQNQSNAPQLDAQPIPLGNAELQQLLQSISPSANATPINIDQAAALSSSMPPGLNQNQSAQNQMGANPNLPPRPPPQEKPAIHPNYAPGDDIRQYHPHSQKNPSASYRAQNALAPISTAGGSAMPPPGTYQQTPNSAISAQSPHTPSQTYRQRDSLERHDLPEDPEAPWGPDIERLFNEFLVDERQYVTDGQWDKFPINSRLFIGNLPTEKVNKRDIFLIFYKYGKLAQISIKQAYGFVQFLDASACQRSLHQEQGVLVRGRKLHLEISKPQKNTRNADSTRDNRNGVRRRSRSPDYTRGGTGGGPPRNVDRYTTGDPLSPRRGRDDYRPGRSPSPRRYGRGGRDRSPRYGRRSRSRSPGYGRGNRHRSPSPWGDRDDDLPLPRRASKDVPDVQVLVLDELDRNFIAYVEHGFQDRGISCDVLLLSARLNEAAVIRRQIIEGVQAVCKLTRASQASSKIPLQIFDRRAGVDNVAFEEYENLDPPIAAELVKRAKSTHQAPAQQPVYGLPPSVASYGLPPGGPPQQAYGVYASPTQHAPPAGPLVPTEQPNINAILSSLGGTDIQHLLAAAQAQQTAQLQQSTGGPTGLTPDLARLLSGAAPAGSYPTAQAAQSVQQQQLGAAINQNPALASLLAMGQGGQGAGVLGQGGQGTGRGAGAGAGGGGPDMATIMAQLAKYR